MNTTPIHSEWWQDTQDIGRLVRAVYACISGPAGAPRDWDRFRYLQHPRATCLRTVVEADGSTRADVFDVESYIADVTPLFASSDFHEIEIEQRVQRFGQVAHVVEPVRGPAGAGLADPAQARRQQHPAMP